MLRLLGARAAIGRLFGDADDVLGAPPSAVLSHGFWRRAFGGDRGVVGQTLQLNEQPYEIIGVLTPNTDLPQDRGSPVAQHTDVWVPMRLSPAGPFYNNHVYPTIARLAPGVTALEAEAELARLTPELPAAFPQAYDERFFKQYGFHTLAYPLKQYVVGSVGRNLWILFGAVGLVLLIACANVANLFLVRAEGRRREIAIRTALGAGRQAIARYALAESLLLSSGGGARRVVDPELPAAADGRPGCGSQGCPDREPVSALPALRQHAQGVAVLRRGAAAHPGAPGRRGSRLVGGIALHGWVWVHGPGV